MKQFRIVPKYNRDSIKTYDIEFREKYIDGSGGWCERHEWKVYQNYNRITSLSKAKEYIDSLVKIFKEEEEFYKNNPPIPYPE